MNHVNYIVRKKGSVIKFFRESRWLSESKIIQDGIKNA